MTSRLIDVMMGMIVTVQINPQAKIDFTYCVRARRPKDRHEAGVVHEPPGRGRLEVRDEQQPPEAVHDAGNGGQQVDDRRQEGPEPTRRVFVDHQCRGDGDRGGDGDPDNRDGNRAHQEGHHAEVVGIGGPGLVEEESESGLSKGLRTRRRTEEDHDGSQEHEDERTAAGKHPVEDPVSSDGLPDQVDRDVVVKSWPRHPWSGRQDAHRPPRMTSRRPIAPVRRSAIPDRKSHPLCGGWAGVGQSR